MKRKRNVVIGIGLITLLVVLGLGQSVLQRVAAAQAKGAVQAPRFGDIDRRRRIGQGETFRTQ